MDEGGAVLEWRGNSLVDRGTVLWWMEGLLSGGWRSSSLVDGGIALRWTVVLLGWVEGQLSGG